MKKVKIAGVVGILVVAAVYYYAALPAINIHSKDLWTFLITMIVIIAGIFAVKKSIRGKEELRNSKGMKTLIALAVVLFVIYCVGGLLSSPIINARKISEFAECENRRIYERYRRTVI